MSTAVPGSLSYGESSQVRRAVFGHDDARQAGVARSRSKCGVMSPMIRLFSSPLTVAVDCRQISEVCSSERLVPSTKSMCPPTPEY